MAPLRYFVDKTPTFSSLDGGGSLGAGWVIGNTLNFITTGAIILGLAHLSETITFEVLHLENIALGGFLHRMIVLAGFVCLVLGFQGLARLRRA